MESDERARQRARIMARAQDQAAYSGLQELVRFLEAAFESGILDGYFLRTSHSDIFVYGNSVRAEEQNNPHLVAKLSELGEVELSVNVYLGQGNEAGGHWRVGWAGGSGDSLLRLRSSLRALDRLGWVTPSTKRELLDALEILAESDGLDG